MKVTSIGSNAVTSRKAKDTKNTKTPFNVSHLATETLNNPVVDNLEKIYSTNPFLALQELDFDYSAEQARFLEASEKLLAPLKELLINLTQAKLDANDFKKLKEITEQNPLKFNSPDLQDLYNEIRLRASVELAKIEHSQR